MSIFGCSSIQYSAQMRLRSHSQGSPSHRTQGRAISLLTAFMLVAGVAVVTTQSVLAAALTNLSWAVSNNQAAATPTNYAYSFKTATTGTIKTVTFTVSGAGLAGAPAIVVAYGIGAGTVALAG